MRLSTSIWISVECHASDPFLITLSVPSLKRAEQRVQLWA